MSRYIDADALCEKLKDKNAMLDYAIAVIKQSPTADVVEVKHGEWIDYKCSVCGFEPYDPSGLDIFPYCSNCGAKMMEAEDD